MAQPGIDIDRLAGDGCGPITAQPCRHFAHILNRHAAAQRRYAGKVFVPRAEAGNTTGPFNSSVLTPVSGYRFPNLRTVTVQLSTSF